MCYIIEVVTMNMNFEKLKNFINSPKFYRITPFLALAAILGVGTLLTLPFGKKEEPPTQFTSGTYSNNVAVRNDGVITIGGSPIFLFGFVHVNEYNNRRGTNLANDIQNIGQAGFNHVQMGITDDDGLDGTAAARAKLAEHHIYNIASYYKPSYQTWINAFKNDPQTIGWNMHDDFNVPYANPTKIPTERFDESTIFRNYATSVGYNTMIFGSGGGYPYSHTPGDFAYRTVAQVPYIFGDYNDSMDIVGVQTYPISNNDESFEDAPLEENIQYIKYAKSRIPANKPLIANLQSFRWPGSGNRYPTAAEGRNMTWAAIVMRVEGISYYAYYDDTGLLPNVASALWTELVQTRLDIQGDPAGDENGPLMRAILDGSYTYIDTNPSVMGQAKIHAATFAYNDSIAAGNYVYAVVINTSSEDSLPVADKITLPTSVDLSTKTALFAADSRYGNTMTTSESGGNKYLNGTLAPMQVQVYRFLVQSEVTPTASPTVSPSVTITASPTVGVTTTVTATPSATVTVAPTVTTTSIPSATASPTAQVTTTVTTSPTVSVSASVTPSGTATPTISGSPAVTASPTTTITVSPSGSVSLTPTATNLPDDQEETESTPTPTVTESSPFGDPQLLSALLGVGCILPLIIAIIFLFLKKDNKNSTQTVIR